MTSYVNDLDEKYQATSYVNDLDEEYFEGNQSATEPLEGGALQSGVAERQSGGTPFR